MTIEALTAEFSLSPKRVESLTIAANLGADDVLLERLARARYLARRDNILLPEGRFQGLSRGTGWCRHGRGASAIWGERERGGYRVSSTGRWVVGSTDGFSRKEQTDWDVEFVQVGDQTWTIAD